VTVAMPRRVRTTCGLFCMAVALLAGSAGGGPAFTPDGKGGYAFDTGLLRGTLCANGKSSGLSSVVHIPTGARLDSGSGICGYYRVFTTNRRYGRMGWDWPGRSRLLPDGAVQITLPEHEDRPFEMIAVYRWRDAATLDVETTVKAGTDLNKFEVFLASYCRESLPSPYVCTQADSGQPSFLPALKSHGDWLMFPRDQACLPIIRDGRWEKEPYPVNWTIMPEFQLPLAFRRGAESAPTVVVMAPRDDCFAVSMPYQGESHYSLYLSLFGRDIKAGESATARARFAVTTARSDAGILEMYGEYMKHLVDSAGPRASVP
jgi:hypothetical protein